MKRHLLPIGLVSIAALALCAAAVLVAMALVLRGDVKALEGQIRSAARMEETLRADIEAMRRDLEATQAAAMQAAATQAAATTQAAETAQAAQAAPQSDVLEPRATVVHAVSPIAATVPARLVKVNSAAPSECAFRPGDPEGLVNCIRQQESRTAGRMYR